MIIPIGIFLFWCFVTAVYNQLNIKWLISFIPLFLMIIPISFTYSKFDFNGFQKYFLCGFLLTIPFAFYDLATSYFGFIPFGSTSALFDYSAGGVLGNFLRVRSTFSEPSFYAIYLCLVFYVQSDFDIKYKKILVTTIIILLLLTLSLTGVFIMAFLVYYKYFRGTIIRKFKTIITVILVTIISYIIFPSTFDQLINRISNTYFSFNSSNITGSEESRINTFPVLINYFTSSDGNILTGEGYSNYEGWLINNYSYAGLLSSFARGQIHNAFAVIGISTGLMGLIIYLSIFLIMGSKNILPWDAIIFHLLIQLSYTLMIGYFLWGILLVIIANKNQKMLENISHTT